MEAACYSSPPHLAKGQTDVRHWSLMPEQPHCLQRPRPAKRPGSQWGHAAHTAKRFSWVSFDTFWNPSLAWLYVDFTRPRAIANREGPISKLRLALRSAWLIATLSPGFRIWMIFAIVIQLLPPRHRQTYLMCSQSKPRPQVVRRHKPVCQRRSD